MEFRAINDSPSSQNGFAPSTLVYGFYPNITGGAGRGSIMERSNGIRECTESPRKMKARPTLGDTIRSSSCSVVIEIEKERRLPQGQDVLIYRERIVGSMYRNSRPRQ